MRQARQIELALRVQAADTRRLMRRQHAIGADDLQRVEIAHEQVIAVRVERIDVEARRAAHVRAHFLGEHTVAQPLRFAQLVFGARPCGTQAELGGDRLGRARQPAARQVKRQRGKWERRRRQFSH